MDNDVSNFLFLDHHDHLGGVQPFHQPGVEPDQGRTQGLMSGQS